MAKVIMALAALSLGVYATTCTVKTVQFKQNCGGYIGQAANANTVELAELTLSRATAYAEKQGLTSGFTSVLWKTPSDDIGFWYRNLTASLDELRRVKEDTSQLERSNLLMKLRETLTDSKKEGTRITVPRGISRYPINKLYFWWLVVSCAALSIACAINEY